MDKQAKTAIALVTVQTVIVFVITVVTLLIAGSRTGLSVLTGGAVGLVATAFFSLRLFAGGPEWLPQRYIRRFYRAGFQKIALIALLVSVAIRWLNVDALPLMLALATVLMANWLVLLFDY